MDHPMWSVVLFWLRFHFVQTSIEVRIQSLESSNQLNFTWILESNETEISWLSRTSYFLWAEFVMIRCCWHSLGKFSLFGFLEMETTAVERRGPPSKRPPTFASGLCLKVLFSIFFGVKYSGESALSAASSQRLIRWILKSTKSIRASCSFFGSDSSFFVAPWPKLPSQLE